MNASTLVNAVRRHLVVATTIFMLALVGTGFYLTRQTPMYTSTVTLAVVPGPRSAQAGGFENIISPLLPSLAVVATSRDVASAAVARVPGAPGVQQLMPRISAHAVAEQLILRISVTDARPVMSAQLANSIAQVIPRYDLVGSQIKLRIVESAQPGVKTSPEYGLVALLGAAVGMIAALAASAYLETRNRAESNVAKRHSGGVA